MTNFAIGFATNGLVSIFVLLSAALGANVCFAQNAPRVELSAESGAKGSKLVAGMEDFSATRSELGQLRASQALAPAVSFLRTYYQLGRSADRDAMLKLYAPDMQPGVALRFKDNKSVEQAFADLGDVDVDSALSWGFYRVVLVKHHAKSNGQQVFPWVHTIACPGRCMFVEEPALAQIASYLFYMTRYGKQTARAAGQGNGMLTLFLNPVFSDKPPLPGLMSDPLELRLVQADAAAQGAGLALLGQLAKYPSEGGALVAAGQALFDAGTPQAYPRKRGDGKTVDEVMWAAYINGVRNKAWTPRYTFQLGSDSAILIAGSAQGDVLFLPFHKVGGGWRLFTTPDKAPFWPLFEGRPFAEAIGKLINKQ